MVVVIESFETDIFHPPTHTTTRRGKGTPLNAVMMLWVNLIMDTMGALALGTDEPTLELLNRCVRACVRACVLRVCLDSKQPTPFPCLVVLVAHLSPQFNSPPHNHTTPTNRRPYKRSARLLSRPMVRNIAGQSLYQVGLLFFLLYEGPKLWGLESGNYCRSWTGGNRKTTPTWTYLGNDYTCNDFQTVCAAYYGPANTGKGGRAGGCVGGRYDGWMNACHALTLNRLTPCALCPTTQTPGECFSELISHWTTPTLYEAACDLRCEDYDYTHFTFMFTAFVFCQIFNECVHAWMCVCLYVRACDQG